MQHTAPHTATVQPSSHNQRHVLIGKQWDQLPELIPTNSNSGLHCWGGKNYVGMFISCQKLLNFGSLLGVCNSHKFYFKKFWICILHNLFNNCCYTLILASLVPEILNQSRFKWGKRWWGLGIQWHQLDHMRTIGTLLKTDNYTNTLIFTGQMLFLTPNQ